MTTARLRFDDFLLDTGSRSLLRGGEAVALNARYFDALVLLVRERGQLVGKQRFFDEVWAGSVVTDAALTQCIKEIRRALGDDASAPRFVRTVAGHGYCFIAAVDAGDAPVDGAGAGAAVDGADRGSDGHDSVATPAVAASPGARRWLAEGGAAAGGGAFAGLLGGLLYGSALSMSPGASGLGGLSVLLVLLAASMLVGLAGALGVGLGLAGGRQLQRGAWPVVAGAALGGLLVGGASKLVGSDAFLLLVGEAPAGITGGLEGAAIGAAIAAGWLLGGGGPPQADPARVAGFAAATTGLAGAVIPLAGGRMMATSLASVAAAFDGSRLDPAPLGRLFGDPQFGALAQCGLGAIEGALFGACVAAALVLGRRLIEGKAAAVR